MRLGLGVVVVGLLTVVVFDDVVVFVVKFELEEEGEVEEEEGAWA